MQALWAGTYRGLYGRARIYARQDRLIVALEGQEVGGLLYQGGNTFVASWDHGIRVAFGAGNIPVARFTVTRRKRVVTYRRGGGAHAFPPPGPGRTAPPPTWCPADTSLALQTPGGL